MKYVPQQGPQTEFHKRSEKEVLFGGAAGGAKTLSLLMEGGRQSDHSGYRAYFFRRTFPQLADAIDKAKAWFPDNYGGSWHQGEKEWRFPSGAAMRFRHMEHGEDWRQYQGHEMHYQAWDELTQFEKDQYDKLKAWNRSANPRIRAYTRCGSNPKGIGHVWVKSRFVDAGPYQRQVESWTDPVSGTVLETDRVFIPARVYDNPALLESDPSYLANLLAMPEDDRKAFLEGSWDVFVGQFFAEWRKDIHTCELFDIPPGWRRFGCLDYGFVSPMSCHKIAVSPDGMLFVYGEVYRTGLNDVRQAQTLAEFCKDDKLDYIVASPDLWYRSGKGRGEMVGHTTVETYQDTWKQLKFHVKLRKADHDRIMGWRRMRVYMMPFQGADGRLTARLQIVASKCPNLVRTLPQLQHSEHDPDDIDEKAEDHAAEGIRYGVMSRPAPKPIQAEVTEHTAEWYMAQHLKKQRQKQYIGAS